MAVAVRWDERLVCFRCRAGCPATALRMAVRCGCQVAWRGRRTRPPIIGSPGTFLSWHGNSEREVSAPRCGRTLCSKDSREACSFDFKSNQIHGGQGISSCVAFFVSSQRGAAPDLLAVRKSRTAKPNGVARPPQQPRECGFPICVAGPRGLRRGTPKTQRLQSGDLEHSSQHAPASAV